MRYWPGWLAMFAYVAVAVAQPILVVNSRELTFQWLPATGPVEAYEVVACVDDLPVSSQFRAVVEQPSITFKPWTDPPLSVMTRGVRWQLTGVCDGAGETWEDGRCAFVGAWSECSTVYEVRSLAGDLTEDGVVGGPDFIAIRSAAQFIDVSADWGEVGWNLTEQP